MNILFKFADGRERYVDPAKSSQRANVSESGMPVRIRMNEVIEREFVLVYPDGGKPMYVENPEGLPDWIKPAPKEVS